MTTRTTQFLAREGVHYALIGGPKLPGFCPHVTYVFERLDGRKIDFVEYHDDETYPIPRSPVDVLDDAVERAVDIQLEPGYEEHRFGEKKQLVQETRAKLLRLMSEDELAWLQGGENE